MGRGVFCVDQNTQSASAGFEERKIVKKIILHVPLSIGLKAASLKRNIRGWKVAN